MSGSLQNVCGRVQLQQVLRATASSWHACKHLRYSTDATGLEDFYDSTVERYAEKPLRKLSLSEMLHFGKDAWYQPNRIIASAHIVHDELPKRLARRLLDLEFLPYVVVTNPHIRRVYTMYHEAFAVLLRFPRVTSLDDNIAFTSMLTDLLDRQTTILDTLARGLRECMAKPGVGPKLELDAFLDAMLRSRISRRVLAEQHIQLTSRRKGYIGVINTELHLKDAVEFAAKRTQQVCCETYGVAPEAVVLGDPTTTIQYIPTHLDYMLYELLKNAMRAVVENNRSSRGVMPAIEVRLCGSRDNGITLRISDQGGGIPNHAIDKVWRYGYTSAAAVDGGGNCGTDNGSNGKGEGLGATSGLPHFDAASSQHHFRMAGLGFGLPLSRLYARYFGGDIRLVSMPGFGVDAYLTLAHLDTSAWLETPDELLTIAPTMAATAGGTVAV